MLKSLVALTVLLAACAGATGPTGITPPPGLAHDPSVLVTSTVARGTIAIRWASRSGVRDSVLLGSPIAAPGLCLRFLVPPGDSAVWDVAASDSDQLGPTAQPQVSTWNSAWFAADSVPAWTLQVLHNGSGSPLLKETLSGGPNC